MVPMFEPGLLCPAIGMIMGHLWRQALGHPLTHVHKKMAIYTGPGESIKARRVWDFSLLEYPPAPQLPEIQNTSIAWWGGV